MTDISKTTTEELTRELLEKKVSLRKFRFGVSGSKTANVKEGRTLRADIARIETELSARREDQASA